MLRLENKHDQDGLQPVGAPSEICATKRELGHNEACRGFAIRFLLMAPRFIARQLSCPTGLLGRFIGVLMNRHNVKMNGFALKLLDLDPADRVLEIGFGGGLNLPFLVRHAAFVAGVDRSVTVVRSAKTRFAEAIAGGRALFREGSVETVPKRN